jgi:large subunit ribosomal protein L9
MKVILISNLKNLGNLGDIVNVKDGYARNYLIPQKFAIHFSNANYKVFEEQKKEIEKQNTENKNSALKNQTLLQAKEIIVLENAGDDGRLYGSVSSRRLAQFSNDLLNSKDIKKSNIVIKEAIKNVGKYKIIFELHPEVLFEKDIIIARTKEEAQKIKSGQWEKEAREKKEAEKKAREAGVIVNKEEKTKTQKREEEEIKEEKKSEEVEKITEKKTKVKAKKEVKKETKTKTKKQKKED